MVLKTLSLIPFLLSAVIATNDWNTPCFGGECSYDLPDQAKGPQGTVKIWSTNKNAITDITPAAGWVILSCDPDALEQNVRLVCQQDESDVNGCGNLFQSLGKSGKIVRLPENCGKAAFGRLASISADKDQTIPANIASKLTSKSPVVRNAVIDVNFKAVDPNETGHVNVAVEAATFPGSDGSLARRNARDSLFDKLAKRGDSSSFVDDAWAKFASFNVSKSTDVEVVNIDQTWTLFDYSISCPAGDGWPAYTATAEADVHVTANAQLTIGVAAVGEVIPPSMSEFGLFVAMNADFDGQFQMTATATGTADTGLVQIFSVGIPGLDIPGILSVGPTFIVNGQATATLDIDVDLDIDLTYTLSNAQLYWPKGSGSGVGVAPGDSSLSLSVNPSLASNAGVQLLIQPQLEVGISAIEGVASANVFLNMDATGDITLSLNAGTGSGVSGCADVTVGLDMHAGADASFFDLFNPSDTVTLFNDSWDIFDQCFGNTKRSEIAPLMKAREIVRRDLSCPATDVQTLVPLT